MKTRVYQICEFESFFSEGSGREMPGYVSASRNNVLAKPSLQVRESFHVVGVYF